MTMANHVPPFFNREDNWRLHEVESSHLFLERTSRPTFPDPDGATGGHLKVWRERTVVSSELSYMFSTPE